MTIDKLLAWLEWIRDDLDSNVSEELKYVIKDLNKNGLDSGHISGRDRPWDPYGQVLLEDQDSIDKIINNLDINENDIILEIGPGQGVLSDVFHDKVGYSHLVEIDASFVEYLKLQKYKNTTIYSEDFLKWKMPYFSDKIKVVSNLPYSITYPIIHKLVPQHQQISKMVLTMAKYQADNLTDPSDQEYKLIEPFFDLTHRFDIPSEHFSKNVNILTDCLVFEHK